MKASANMQPHEKSVLQCIYQWQISGVKDPSTGRTVHIKYVPWYLVVASLSLSRKAVLAALNTLSIRGFLNDGFMAYLDNKWQLPDGRIIESKSKYYSRSATMQWTVAVGKKQCRGADKLSVSAARMKNAKVAKDDCNAYKLTQAGIEQAELMMSGKGGDNSYDALACYGRERWSHIKPLIVERLRDQWHHEMEFGLIWLFCTEPMPSKLCEVQPAYDGRSKIVDRINTIRSVMVNIDRLPDSRTGAALEYRKWLCKLEAALDRGDSAAAFMELAKEFENNWRVYLDAFDILNNPPSSKVILRDHKTALVMGKEKTLTPPRYKVVKALLKAGKSGLSKDRLVNISGVTDAVNVLKRLSKSDSDWNNVIELAGTTGGGYRIHAQ